jgi:hypothetical protein
MRTLALLTTLLLAACLGDAEPDQLEGDFNDDDESVRVYRSDAPLHHHTTAELMGHDTASVNGSCSYVNGANWCHDLYTKRWCTNSTGYAQGWDYTGCKWSRWAWVDQATPGYYEWVYCHPDYPGYQWSSSHRHCPQ